MTEHDLEALGPRRRTEVDSIVEVAAQAQPIPQVDLGDGLRLTRDGNGIIERWDHEPFAPYRRRPAGDFQLDTEQAFAAYVEMHGVEGETCVYARQGGLSLTAILNDHPHDREESGGGWRDWQAYLRLEHGRAWDAWTAIQERWLPQSGFIDMLEDRINDVVNPPATDLLDLVSHFSAHKTVNFRSATQLGTGAVQLMYEETITGAGGRADQMTVPERIEVALDPIKGDDPFKVRARLRWRIDEGKLLVMVKFDRLDDILEEAWGGVVERVRAAVAPFPVLEGSA